MNRHRTRTGTRPPPFSASAPCPYKTTRRGVRGRRPIQMSNIIRNTYVSGVINMQARITDNRQQWNDFVAASPCCNITQSYEWADLAPHLGAEAMRTGVIDDNGNLLAVMLILIIRAPILRRNYFYAPRGPIIDDPSSPALTVLLDFIKAEARKRGAFMLKVEPS